MVLIGGQNFPFRFTADGAGPGPLPILEALRLPGDGPVGPGVTLGNRLALFQNLAANGTDQVTGVAIFRAGGFLGIYGLTLMAKRLGDLTDVGVVTTLTCVFCIAIACAGTVFASQS